MIGLRFGLSWIDGIFARVFCQVLHVRKVKTDSMMSISANAVRNERSLKMKITLRVMSEKEFEAYSDYSINDYVKDLMKSSEMAEEEALA